MLVFLTAESVPNVRMYAPLVDQFHFPLILDQRLLVLQESARQTNDYDSEMRCIPFMRTEQDPASLLARSLPAIFTETLREPQLATSTNAGTLRVPVESSAFSSSCFSFGDSLLGEPLLLNRCSVSGLLPLDDFACRSAFSADRSRAARRVGLFLVRAAARWWGCLCIL
jgi:hypothetical protein